MSILGKLFSVGATTLVSAVGDAIDKNFTSDEERLEQENELAKATYAHTSSMRALDIEEQKVTIGDRKDARAAQTVIQTSEYSGWLSKNIHPILALITVIATFSLYGFLIYAAISGNAIVQTSKEIILYILGGLTAMCTQIYSYFFGSSAKGHDTSVTEAITRKFK